MKRVAIAILFATMIGLAPAPAHAKKTIHQEIVALKKADAKKTKQIAALTQLARLANARAIDAQESFAFLTQCILVQPAGSVNVLDPTTSVVFSQGSIDGVVPDFLQWFPVTRTVIAPDGPNFIALLDPNCIVTPSPAPAQAGWHPRHVTLSFR